ncbi:unnamed protein product [Sphacelaria rigidula]
MDPVGLYLYLLRSLSDTRLGLLEDNKKITNFVARL